MATSHFKNPSPAEHPSRERAAVVDQGNPAATRSLRRRTSQSTDDRVIRVVREIPRHRFFPPGVDRATPNDRLVPIGGGRIIPPVDVVVMMLQALELEGTERVLDVGGGSGYQAALLGRLAREVVSVESDDELVRRAASTLAKLGSDNVRVVRASVFSGWPERAPYQAIIVGGGATELPAALVEQLDDGGRIVIPLGDSGAQLVEWLQKHRNCFDSKTIGACRLGMLPSSGQNFSSFPWTRHGHTR